MTSTPKKYYRHSDLVIEDTGAADVVAWMRAGAMDQGGSVAEYMAMVATRAESQTGKPVRTVSPEAFIEDLVSAGLLEVVEENL